MKKSELLKLIEQTPDDAEFLMLDYEYYPQGYYDHKEPSLREETFFIYEDTYYNKKDLEKEELTKAKEVKIWRIL